MLGALRGGAVPLAVSAAAFVVAVGLPAADADMWWHLASGRWMAEERTGLRVDVFSSTATGEPYALGQWLGDLVLYLAYALAGWPAVAVLRAALVALAAFGVARLALRGAPPAVAVPVAALALVLSKPVWTDRPQLFTLALFPIVLDLCLAARRGSRSALAAAVVLVALWANFHGGFALGLAMLWIFALEAVLERRPAFGPLAAATIASAVVTLEPGALGVIRALGHVAGSDIRIAEESPVDPLTPFGALFALFVAATLALPMLRGGSLLGAMVLIPLLGLALSAQRHIPLFGFAAVPFLVAPLASAVTAAGTALRGIAGRGWSRRPGSPPGPDVFPCQVGTDPCQIGTEPHHPRHEEVVPPDGRRRLLASEDRALGPAVALVLWLAAVASIAGAPAQPDASAYPSGAVDALRASRGVLLNEYDWGGYLIWSVPERPVFVDGRLYPFVGNGVMRSYLTAIHVLPAWRAELERWNVAQALVRPDRALAQALRDEGWTVRAQGRDFVLLERQR